MTFADVRRRFPVSGQQLRLPQSTDVYSNLLKSTGSRRKHGVDSHGISKVVEMDIPLLSKEGEVREANGVVCEVAKPPYR